MILLLLACAGGDRCVPPDRPDATLAVSFADPLFSEGGMAVGDASGLECPGFGTSADALVRVVGDTLYVVERGSANAVAAFTRDSWRRPLWQVALPERANAHDLVGLDGRLYLPLYDEGTIAVIDAGTGALLDPLEVPGATPALDRAVVVGDRLWVADQRFDRRTFGASAGVLLEIEPTSGVVIEHPAGVNPRLSAGRTPDELLVATGLLSLGDDPERLTDGDLRAFDTAASTWSEPLVTEAALQADVHGVIAVDGRLVATVVDGQAHSRVHCVGVGDGPSDPGWFVASTALDGDVLVASRASLAGPETLSTRALLRIDPADCAVVDQVELDRDPYDVISLP